MKDETFYIYSVIEWTGLMSRLLKFWIVKTVSAGELLACEV